MKASTRSAGICASGMFILLCFTTIFKTLDPTNPEEIASIDVWGIFYLAVPGAIFAGIIGYVLGLFWSNPKGNRSRSRKPSRREVAYTPTPGDMPLSGDETFLDDLDSTPLTSQADEIPEEED